MTTIICTHFAVQPTRTKTCHVQHISCFFVPRAHIHQLTAPYRCDCSALRLDPKPPNVSDTFSLDLSSSSSSWLFSAVTATGDARLESPLIKLRCEDWLLRVFWICPSASRFSLLFLNVFPQHRHLMKLSRIFFVKITKSIALAKPWLESPMPCVINIKQLIYI